MMDTVKCIEKLIWLWQCPKCGWRNDIDENPTEGSNMIICDECLECYRPEVDDQSDNLLTCPNCRGPADNGHDRCMPPNPYYCTKCEREKTTNTDMLRPVYDFRKED